MASEKTWAGSPLVGSVGLGFRPDGRYAEVIPPAVTGGHPSIGRIQCRRDSAKRASAVCCTAHYLLDHSGGWAMPANTLRKINKPSIPVFDADSYLARRAC